MVLVIRTTIRCHPSERIVHSITQSHNLVYSKLGLTFNLYNSLQIPAVMIFLQPFCWVPLFSILLICVPTIPPCHHTFAMLTVIVAAYSILDVENDVGSGNFDMIKVSPVLLSVLPPMLPFCRCCLCSTQIHSRYFLFGLVEKNYYFLFLLIRVKINEQDIFFQSHNLMALKACN